MKNRWSLVVHQVSQTSAEIWVGTLFADCRKPALSQVTLVAEKSGETREIEIANSEWQRPFRDLNQRFYVCLDVQGLTPGTHYSVSFEERLDSGWQKWTSGSLSTLPNALPQEGAFTVALGSCFYEEYDGGAVSNAYETLRLATLGQPKPDIKFLTGDQVYLDIGIDSLSTVKREIHERIANDYAMHWQALRGVLRHGGTWMLADDHEYWNNYPHVNFNPFLLALKNDKVRRYWTRSAQDGVDRIQRITPVRIFSIGSDLSFCVADLRSRRTALQLLPRADFDQIVGWVNQLTCPGVLVLPQPLVVKAAGDGDKNLLSYAHQYGQLVRAIARCQHDVLVLSGDVHYGRIAQVVFNERGHKLVEVVSSPLSNLSGVGSLAANSISRSSRLSRFPDIAVTGVEPVTVSYPSGRWSVSTESNVWDFRYLKKRTKEHFMTLEFRRTEEGVQVDVQAWKVRETDRRTGLPKRDFTTPLQFTLR